MCICTGGKTMRDLDIAVSTYLPIPSIWVSLLVNYVSGKRVSATCLLKD